MTRPMTRERLDELLPCPFCGGEAALRQGAPGCWFGQCMTCQAASDDCGRDRAIELWNRRPSQPAEGELREIFDSVPLPHHYALSREEPSRRLWDEEDMRDYAFAAMRRVSRQGNTQTINEAFNRGGRDGWMRCGVFNIDIDFEGCADQKAEIERRYPLSGSAPTQGNVQSARDDHSGRLINRFEQLEGPLREIGAEQLAQELYDASAIMREQYDALHSTQGNAEIVEALTLARRYIVLNCPVSGEGISQPIIAKIDQALATATSQKSQTEKPVCSTYHSRAIGVRCTNCGHYKEEHATSQKGERE